MGRLGLVTSQARHNLWSGILELKDDYKYSDTDSVKFTNIEKHLDYFNNYNKKVVEKLEKAFKFHKIDISLAHPKNIKGEEKMIGIWDYEGKIIDGKYIPTYKRFATLGSKRYVYEDDKGFNITIAGLPKKSGREYMATNWYYDLKTKKEYNSPFDLFKDGMKIDAEYTGKNCHTYIDYETEGIMKDYEGIPYHYHEYTSIHMEATSFEMSLASEYIKYLLMLKEEYI